MFRSPHQNILFLSFLLLWSSLVYAQIFNCNPQNRPTAQSCASQPIVTTCAYFTDNCPRDVCGRGANNGCYACSNPDVLYYELKQCDEDVLIQACSGQICNQNFPYYQILAYTPACGLEEISDDDSDQQTFENACKLCEDDDYKYFRLGPCEKDRVYCEDSDASDASDASDDVCAFFTTPDVGSVFTTAPSGPEACDDPAVLFWTRGECGPVFGNITYCLPNNRPDDCSDDSDPVCGYFKGVNGQVSSRIINNPCSACAAPEILYHTPTPCTSA